MRKTARLIAASDIFGRTPHLDELVRALGGPPPQGAAVIDPYGGEPCAFADEASAYAAFQAAGGLSAYAARLAGTLRKAGEGAALLGFSAGGAAVWLAACGPSLPLPRLAVCVYAGQIRHHAELVPRCPCRLILPRREERFDVGALAARLHGAPNVRIETAPYLHGFMNPLSRNFDAAGCTEWTARIAGLLATAEAPLSGDRI